MQTNWYPNFRPTGYWSNLLRAVLNKTGGKFSPNFNYYTPVNGKLILIDGSPLEIAMEVPHLNTVLATGAELFSLMEIKHLNKDGEPVENSEVLKFLKKPNPVQNQEQFLYWFYILNGVYNKTFQHKIKGLSYEKLPKALWLLPPGDMKINTTGKMFRQTDLKEIIKNYEMINDETPFEVENIIYMTEGIGLNILNPISRVEALKIPLSNIVGTLKSRNIFITQRGPNYILSLAAPKDGDGYLPYEKDEAAKIEKDFMERYDLDNQGGHTKVSAMPLQLLKTSFNVNELGLLEGTEDDFAQIIAAFRHDRDIYPSVKGATYENKQAGMKATIQNGLQPTADKLMRQWTAEFLDEKSGEKLEACFEHLPAMKEDERLAAQGKLYKIQGLSIALRDNVIAHEQYAAEAELEMDGSAEPPSQPSPNYQNQNGNTTE